MLGIYFWNGDKTQKDAFRIFRSLLIGLEDTKHCANWLSQTTCYCIDGIGRSVTNGKTQNQEFINFGDESFNNLIKVLI